MLATLSLSLPTSWVPTPSSSSQSACSAGGRAHRGGGRQFHRKPGSRPQKHGARSFDVKVWKLKIQSRSARGRRTGAIPTAKEPVRGNEVRVPVTPEVLGQGELCAALAFTVLPLGGWDGRASSPVYKVRYPRPHSRMLKGYKGDLHQALHPGMPWGGSA